MSVPGATLGTRIALWTIPAAMGALYAQRLGSQNEPGAATWQLVAIALTTWYVWVLFTPLAERLADRWPLRGALRRLRLLAHGSAHLAAAVLFTAWQALGTAVASAGVGTAQWRLVPVIALQWFLALLPAGVVVYGAVVAFRQANVTRVRLEQRERHAEQLMLALRDAQLTALRAQLQPHFLFNTLTAITALVRDGESQRAAAALEQLSVLLRSALRATDEHEATLATEVDRVLHYVRIEEMRLGRPLAVRVELPDVVAQALVPAWVLQPIVENSVRHGFRTAAGAGTLEIAGLVREGWLELSVRDDGIGLPDNWEQRAALGYGVANTRARLAALHGEQARLSLERRQPAGTSVTMRLPFRAGGA